MNNNILLSFLELSNSEFEFAIYRKSSDNTSKSNGMFRYNLPTSTRADRDTYDVSFKEIDETTKFIAKSTDNINMTKKWLMGVLLEKAIATFNKSEFYVGNPVSYTHLRPRPVPPPPRTGADRPPAPPAPPPEPVLHPRESSLPAGRFSISTKFIPPRAGDLALWALQIPGN